MHHADYKNFWPILLLLIVLFTCGRLLQREGVTVLKLRGSVKKEERLQLSAEVLSNSILQLRKTNKIILWQVDSLRKNLTDFTHQGEIVLALTREINRHKMRLITLKPGVINKHGNLDMLPIEIQASGGFRDVCRLIYTLESMGNNYQIRRFSQQLQKETSVVTDVELSLDVILHKRENIEKSG